jgi:hypothetical protein
MAMVHRTIRSDRNPVSGHFKPDLLQGFVTRGLEETKLRER